MLCPYCKESIQEEAKKCRYCGEYLDPDLREKHEVQTVERTGKKWKVLLILSIMMMVVGFCAAAGADNGNAGAAWLLMSIVGFVSLILSRVGAWWQHG